MPHPTLPLRARPTPLATALVLAVLVGLGAAGSSREAGAQGQRPTPTDSALVARADLGRIAGSADAPVWLIVVSDYQCPYCKRWHEETAPRLEREYIRTGKVRIAYLNFPITSHRNALPAHDMAMCAAEQGSFWKASDAIFATQAAWKDRRDAAAYFDSLAGTLRLDHARLRACVKSGALRPLISADYDRALRRGIGSTPTFFVGSRLVIGAQPYEVFRDALEQELAAARASRP
jgi:protein-disulfide isomerase